MCIRDRGVNVLLAVIKSEELEELILPTVAVLVEFESDTSVITTKSLEAGVTVGYAVVLLILLMLFLCIF